MIGENLIDGTNRHEPKNVVTKSLGFWVVVKMKGKREEITYFERPGRQVTSRQKLPLI